MQVSEQIKAQMSRASNKKYEEMDMPELHTYDKTRKSENGIVQNAQE